MGDPQVLQQHQGRLSLNEPSEPSKGFIGITETHIVSFTSGGIEPCSYFTFHHSGLDLSSTELNFVCGVTLNEIN